MDKVKVPLITTVDTIQVVDKTTKTPMVLYRTVNKNISISDWFIDFTNKYRKDIFYTGVDIRNTKGTYNLVSSPKNEEKDK
ncbi:hypothetical protein [Clostridium sp. JS66]|uniref:hypothetical protein n=1 Tax=Clostridium sp. JS66 TaxID=3064705 RepID=UPI00298ECAF7|nr:hypothetical protein [Clostridium sp. JS66]WPC43870.1 hypothetical protein Q6H37_10445 [Clostridium sp. JS66]